MRHFLEMNETEMTSELGRPLTTVRWWLRTARNRLRGILQSLWQMGHPGEDERKS
jgi:DNA-directed RNA polymerase specialized sigma24 family protein